MCVCVCASVIKSALRLMGATLVGLFFLLAVSTTTMAGNFFTPYSLAIAPSSSWSCIGREHSGQAPLALALTLPLALTLTLTPIALPSRSGPAPLTLTLTLTLTLGGKLDEDEEAPTASLIEPPSTPAYEARPPHARHSKHEGLFWGGRAGPMRLIFLVRTLLLVCSMTLALILAWATNQQGGWKVTLADA